MQIHTYTHAMYIFLFFFKFFIVFTYIAICTMATARREGPHMCLGQLTTTN
jgi:hypothetical protein